MLNLLPEHTTNDARKRVDRPHLFIISVFQKNYNFSNYIGRTKGLWYIYCQLTWSITGVQIFSGFLKHPSKSLLIIECTTYVCILGLCRRLVITFYAHIIFTYELDFRYATHAIYYDVIVNAMTMMTHNTHNQLSNVLHTGLGPNREYSVPSV